MSTSNSPISAPIQPLHNPQQAAHVVVPLANVANQQPGMGAKALLAKKMAKNINPTYVSPTDNLMTPCTQKLSAAKKKHFTKSTKPIQLFAATEEKTDDSDDDESPQPAQNQAPMEVDAENPF
ncbi:RING-type domain-containing protein [Mycena kentingensis (nom. inval.)]|nr:RING-type domain-containing protein [Mycena kentingensis (nom. inval.)]